MRRSRRNWPEKISAGGVKRRLPAGIKGRMAEGNHQGIVEVFYGYGTADDVLAKMHAYWRAANYLSVGQIYLMDNPLLKRPLEARHIKPSLLGHWGTTPGQNFIYVHLNRIIKEYDLDLIYVAGPGHGGPALVANTYLEGTYSARSIRRFSRDEAGIEKAFHAVFFSRGDSAAMCRRSVRGRSMKAVSWDIRSSHAFGAVLDNPDLVVACVIGDGEAETGPLATAWHSNKFLDPATDGAVLPILHLNGYKISNPTLLARIPEEELREAA